MTIRVSNSDGGQPFLTSSYRKRFPILIRVSIMIPAWMKQKYSKNLSQTERFRAHLWPPICKQRQCVLHNRLILMRALKTSASCTSSLRKQVKLWRLSRSPRKRSSSNKCTPWSTSKNRKKIVTTTNHQEDRVKRWKIRLVISFLR